MSRPIHVLQFGEGNFLRAFVDWMFTISNQRQVTDVRIVIVKPRSGGQAILDTFRSQHCCFHVYLEGAENNTISRELIRVDCIDDIVSPYLDKTAYRNYILDPKLEILISNTSEAGIVYRPENILDNQIPEEFPAKITRLLYDRYQFFEGDLSKGIHLICCELIDNNADSLKSCVQKHIEVNHLGHSFSRWVERSCHFHNSLVDRIVSGYPHDEAADIEAQIGQKDLLLTKAELYHSWIIEDDEALQQLMPLDRVGLNVRFCSSVGLYREWKVRILNGQHTAMAIIGLLLGIETVADIFSHSKVNQFISRLLNQEILPLLNGNRAEVEHYSSQIEQRLRNPCIKHSLNAIFLNSISKWVVRLYPDIVGNNLQFAKHSPFCTFTLAALLYIYSGQAHQSLAIHISDDVIIVQKIRSCFARQLSLDRIIDDILSDASIWNQELRPYPTFSSEVSFYFSKIQEMGIEVALDYLLNEQQ